MPHLFTAEQTRQLDAAAIAAGTPGLVLMKRAGRAAFERARRWYPNAQRWLIFCGGGNNGGDGYVVAALAKQAGLQACVVAAKAPEALRNEAAGARDYAVQEGVEIVAADVFLASPHCVGEVDLVFDALLGTGIQGQLKAPYAALISWINAQTKPVIALDVPSGIDSDTGNIVDSAVRATATLTFIAYKRGLFVGAARDCCGQLELDALGLDIERLVTSSARRVTLLQPQSLCAHLARHADSHKGSHGHALIVGGAPGMFGALVLCAEAALYSGVGLISLYSRAAEAGSLVLRLPEVMRASAMPKHEQAWSRYRAVAIGPGLGQSDAAQHEVQAACDSGLPLVLDADALNLLAKGEVLLPEHRNIVLTPHPGEAARLLGCTTAELQADRFAAAQALVERYGVTVVLKGAGTVIASTAGLRVCAEGNAAMAVAGMGDTLCGILVALLAQGLNAEEAADLGVWLHARAGDDAAAQWGQIGIRASELGPLVRNVLHEQISHTGG